MCNLQRRIFAGHFPDRTCNAGRADVEALAQVRCGCDSLAWKKIKERLHILAVSINANSKERLYRETSYVWRQRSSAEKDLSVSARQLQA